MAVRYLTGEIDLNIWGNADFFTRRGMNAGLHRMKALKSDVPKFSGFKLLENRLKTA